MNLSITPSAFMASVEEAVAKTLDDRFQSIIHKIIPDLYIDLLPRKGIEQDAKAYAAIESKTGVTEFFNVTDLNRFLADRKVKTIGILEPSCEFKTFIGESDEEVRNEIFTYSENQLASVTKDIPYGDGLIFQGSEKYFGYTNTLLSHIKIQIAELFKPFFEAGGAIVSVQDRLLPMTCFALEEFHYDDITHSVILCELSHYGINIWIAISCDNGIFCPLVSQSGDSLSNAGIEFLFNSVMAQARKQYNVPAPTIAALINSDESRNTEATTHLMDLISQTCGEKIISIAEDKALYASLLGARMIGTGGEIH